MKRPFCQSNIVHQDNWLSIIDFFINLQIINNNDFVAIPTTDHSARNQKLIPMSESCSEDTLFVWFPFLILMICFPFELFWTRRRWFQDRHRSAIKYSMWSVHQQQPLLTIFYLAKLISIILITSACLFRLCYRILYSDQNPLELLEPYAPFIADVLRLIGWIIILTLLIFNRQHNRLSSGTIFIYLLLESLVNLYLVARILENVFDAQDNISGIWSVNNDPMMFGSRFIYASLIFFTFLIECQSDDDALAARYRFNNNSPLRDKLISPELSASFFSRLTFNWFGRLIGFGSKSLNQDDLWLLADENTSNTIWHSSRQSWPLKRDKLGLEEADIMNLLFRMHASDLLWIALLKLGSSLFLFVNPVVLDCIIGFLSPVNQQEPLWKGILYAGLMFVSPMIESMLNNQHEYRINLVTMRMKTLVTSLIYQKSLRLSNSAKQQFSTGEIVNLINVDVMRIVDLVNNINTLWSAPLQIVIGVYLLWLQLSYASLAGFSYMLIIVPVNIFLTNKIRFMQINLMTKKDHRSKLMNEILQGIKVIKLNGWERHFEQRIAQHRHAEVKHLKYIAYCATLMVTCFSSAAVFVALFSFLAYTLMSPDNILDANKAFVSLALFNIIRVPLSFLPMFFSFAGIAFVSIERIDDFLNAPEISSEQIVQTGQTVSLMGPSPILEQSSSFADWPKPSMGSAADLQQTIFRSGDEPTIVIRIANGNFNWIEDDPVPTINSIDLQIRKRSLVAVVGGVGSGKSSLLAAMLGEMEKLSGQVEIRGKIAYVPQEPWILNATIRDNIILNKKYDEKKYRKVLEACSLQIDMAMFAAGDMTEVGEKGINLSGGQRQRISLARAIYSNSDIYLLDNPLSALDIHVGQHIFDHVIGPKGCLRNKTRILVTAKMSLLPLVDEIVYISRGEIKDQGRFDDLIERRGPFSEYVAEYFIDQQSGFETDLDEDDNEFVAKMVPKIQRVIERVTLSRSISLNRNQSMSESKHHSTFVSQTLNRSFSRSSYIESDDIFSETVNITSQGRLIQAEEIAEGATSSVNHRIYFKTVGVLICLSVLLTLAISNVFQLLGSLWLSDWSNDSLLPPEQLSDELRMRRLIVFAVLAINEVLFTFLGSLQVYLGCVRASKLLHNQMIGRILRAPMSFFDTTPIGRILNRFTRDVDIVDQRLSTNIRLLTMQSFRTVVAFGLIAMEAPIILLFLFPLTILYYLLQKIFIRTSRQLKRIEAVSRSPMNSHLSETVNGTTSIRAYGLVRKFSREMLKRIDENNRSYWLSFTAARWLAVRLELLSYSIVFLATLMAILSRGTISPGVAGLAISYSLNITSILNLLIRAYSEIETNFVSVERIVEYMETPKEQQLLSAQLARIPFDWPFKGEILFDSYSTQYRPGLKLCLKRLTLKIPGGSKVAIVGRTGSGKSSLALALFRVLEPVEGSIFIDKIDIRKITLETLRKSLTIVPQEPVIFTGTIRENVDLLSEHPPGDILQALNDANLGSFLETINHDINYQLIASGDSLSAGQRQLICLARALLKKSLIIVFDEAAASVDHETDQQINKTIFSNVFKSKTILMIAHRLDNIMNYDYVIVMNNGEIEQFDNPQKLALQKDGQFFQLAKEAKII